MKIQILGTGCGKCRALAANVRTAMETLEISAPIEHVEDMQEIIKYGDITMPALIIDGKVKVTGRVPIPDELEEVLKEHCGEDA